MDLRLELSELPILCHHCDGEVERVDSSYCCKGCEDAEEAANYFDY